MPTLSIPGAMLQVEILELPVKISSKVSDQFLAPSESILRKSLLEIMGVKFMMSLRLEANMWYPLKEMFLKSLFLAGTWRRRSCKSGQFYEPSLMDCLDCPVNASLVTSADGFACSCEEHSVATNIARCKPCNITEVVSSDGTACVPRRCQSSAGRMVCRKCPQDHILVTQLLDGSPMKEVQCIKCARGYKVFENRCVKCEACSCKKHEIIVRGRCIPKKYILSRPKYNENQLHPNELLEIVKLEYLCTQQDFRACRRLASACVRNFYSLDPGGPCRLWVQPNIGEFKGKDILKIATGIHTKVGGLDLFLDTNHRPNTCLPPINIKIGDDFSYDCVKNVSKLTEEDFGSILELYLLSETSLEPLSIKLIKPNGYDIQKGKWPSKQFRKFFLFNKSLSTVTNTTNTVYLRTLLFQITIERDASTYGLRLQMTIEAHYATKSPLTDIVTTSLRVEHKMPTAGVLRGLEICGGVFGSLMTLYALLQWRGVLRRGGLWFVVMPLLSSCIADALYFAMLISVFHALVAEAGTLALTLPLSQAEEQAIEAVVYSVICLKVLKVIWINWNQCRCDIFFIDWSKYNPPIKDASIQNKSKNWKEAILAKEWMSKQTKRRVSPGFTAVSTLFILHFVEQTSVHLSKSQGYKWVIASVAWWSCYTVLLCTRFLIEKFIKSAPIKLTKICSDLELSLLVFEHEYYAHYVDGRNEDLIDFRPSVHALQTCRVVCSPQLRNVYKKLSNNGELENNSNRALLSQFLSAFFERALDGLNWVASERTIFEKLFDVELVAREGGSTSVLLYDGDVTTPSCFAVTWWGEEWTLATFDSMLFGCIVIMTGNSVLSALITLITWQIMKCTREFFGNFNVKNKVGLNN
ncbi:meckelin-like [Vanessa cardui]|uniref:meckelin-like n=1 Tax=Vanessa cardui TaxID=171605 RepID=UPI001F143D48|nr:meckelin-like [Vanessa cardui]